MQLAAVVDASLKPHRLSRKRHQPKPLRLHHLLPTSARRKFLQRLREDAPLRRCRRQMKRRQRRRLLPKLLRSRLDQRPSLLLPSSGLRRRARKRRRQLRRHSRRQQLRHRRLSRSHRRVARRLLSVLGRGRSYPALRVHVPSQRELLSHRLVPSLRPHLVRAQGRVSPVALVAMTVHAQAVLVAVMIGRVAERRASADR